MTPTKWLSSIAVIGLLLIGGAFFFFRSDPVRENVSVSVPITVSATATATFVTAPPMKRVMDLYETESKRVGRIDPDPKATQKRLEGSAKELSEEELRWLENQVFDGKTDPDARFFAVYLLGLSGKASAMKSLARLALSPIPPSKNERKVEEERVIRAHAVEGMCAGSNCQFEDSRNGLLDVVSQQMDDFLRDRAHRCLYKCQTGKEVETQDTEALKKVREKQ